MSVRVLIADDSAVARGILKEILEKDPGIRVVGEARDGREAVDLCRALGPDLVTMDLRMPGMDGLEAIGRIMAENPVPILVVSSVGDARDAYDAVQRGALDTVGKDGLGELEGTVFAAKVKLLSQVKVISHLRPRSGTASGPGPGPAPVRGPRSRVVAIASSTGGPQALARILGDLPAGFACPVLVAQHMTDGFAPGLAKWLASVCRLPVSVAAAGDPLVPGRVYLSPSEKNLTVDASFRAVLRERNDREIFHPTCDVLLSSVAEVCGAQAIGVILTGMGRDGAQGMLDLFRAGAQTLAQDEASSVVFGMNKAAIDLGAVRQVAALADLPSALVRLTGGGRP